MISARLDHLVVAAATLAQGAAWCEATLGVTPAAGGRHALFGTHNRLLRLADAAWPDAYLEIIALDPDAAAPARARWFGLDDPVLQRKLHDGGPRLLHWVARTAGLDAAVATLAVRGLEAGVALEASRPSAQGPAQGLLRWRIAVRDDGALPAGGLPTLIEWLGPHPTATLPESGVRLHSLAVRGLDARAAALLEVPGVQLVAESGPAGSSGTALTAQLNTPLGRVTLESA